MLERLTALYTAGRIGPEQIDAAVDRGWITRDQADAIMQVPT